MSVVIGIGTQPSDIELMVLAQYVKEYHPAHTVEEIKVAIEMNNAGKFHKKIEHFQVFSGSYISDILNLYDEEKLNTVKNITQINFKEAEQKRMEEYNELQKSENHITHWNSITKWISDNKIIPPAANWSKLFDYLWKESKAFTFDELSDYMATEKPKIIAEIQNKLKTTINRGDRAALEIDLQENSLKQELRKRVVIKYLQDNVLPNL